MRRVTPLLFGVLAAGAMVAHCGRLVESDDGGVSDAAEAEDTIAEGTADAFVKCGATPFQTATPIAELAAPDNERNLRLTPDEMTAVFERYTINDAGVTLTASSYLSARSSLGAAFGVPSEQFAGSVTPSLAGDALTIYFQSQCGNPAARALCYCKRPTVQDIFTGPVEFIASFITQNNGPFQNGGDWGDGYVTADTSTYYFVAPSSPDGGVDGGESYGIFQSQRPPCSDDASVCPIFGNPSPVFVPPDPSIFVDNPIVTADELTLLLSTRSPNDAAPHIQTATRASTSDAFGPLTPLHQLDSAEGEYPTWISVDQCRLYMTRKVGGSWRLYMASRSP